MAIVYVCWKFCIENVYHVALLCGARAGEERPGRAGCLASTTARHQGGLSTAGRILRSNDI